MSFPGLIKPGPVPPWDVGEATVFLAEYKERVNVTMTKRNRKFEYDVTHLARKAFL